MSVTSELAELAGAAKENERLGARNSALVAENERLARQVARAEKADREAAEAVARAESAELRLLAALRERDQYAEQLKQEVQLRAKREAQVEELERILASEEDGE